MDRNAYVTHIQSLTEANPLNLIALGKWVQERALPWLWAEMSGAFFISKKKHPDAKVSPATPKLQPLVDSDAVRMGLIVSLSDEKKIIEPGFYRAQLTMLDSEANRYCTAIHYYANEGPGPNEEAFVHTVHPALHNMMLDALVLLEWAASKITEVPGFFNAHRTSHDKPFEVYKGAEQITYGTYSRLTHTDRVPYASVAVLRTAIELRLRRAFCVSTFIDPTRPDELIPIDMSRLYDAILTQQESIKFAVDIHDVWKVYKWCNFYLHSGLRDFPWVPGFLVQYLRPLFSGPRSKRGINEGVQMNLEVWHAVRAALPRPMPLGEKREFILATEGAPACVFLR